MECKREIPPTAARVYVKDRWLCPDCIYAEEYGKLIPERQIQRRRKPQQERLFNA